MFNLSLIELEGLASENYLFSHDNVDNRVVLYDEDGRLIIQIELETMQ